MRSTECKEINYKHSKASNYDGDVDVSLFEKFLSIIECGDPLHTNTKRYTHEIISTQQKITNGVHYSSIQ